jgi:hypothetical protein
MSFQKKARQRAILRLPSGAKDDPRDLGCLVIERMKITGRAL